ncbi:MAG: hypothetical protein KIT45_01430 [Fimbriimonadia bacterium]|nr:hypothetical protein [Fimbriimonadia bacterium]
MKKVTVTVGLFSVAFVFSWIQSNSDNPVVAADKKMVEVGKPLQLTTDGYADHLAWSPKGDLLFYVWMDEKPQSVSAQMEAKEEPEIIEAVGIELRSYDGKRTTTLKRTLSPINRIKSLHHIYNLFEYRFLPQKRTFLISYYALSPVDNAPQPFYQPQAFVELLPLNRGQTSTVICSAENAFFTIEVSPKEDYALVRRLSEKEPFTELLDLKTLARTKVLTGRQSFITWRKSGGAFYFEDLGIRPVSVYRYDLSTGKPVEVTINEVMENQISESKHETSALQLSSSEESSHPKYNLHPLYLNSKKTTVEQYQSALISLDSQFSEEYYNCALSPAENAVAYVNWRDQLFIVPLIKRDPTDLREKVACGAPVSEEDKQKYYLENAKAIGTAMQLYVQDYDEHYPLSHNAVDTLRPYIKDDDAFNSLSGTLNFRYLGNGEQANKVSPDSLVGYLDIGGTTVVGIYGDGSVRMTPRPK